MIPRKTVTRTDKKKISENARNITNFALFFQKKHILLKHLHALENKGMNSRFLPPPPLYIFLAPLCFF